MSFLQKIYNLNNEFLQRLNRHDSPRQGIAPQILSRILECDEDVVELSLGKFGLKLRSFANKLDFAHPEIISIFDGTLANDQEFAQECLELLSLTHFARDNKLTKIIPILGRILTKESLSKAVIKKIDSSYNRLYVRLLKDPIERKEIRSTKKRQIIDLESIYNKGEEIWNAQPDSFSRFLRFNSAYQDDLKFAEKKLKRYEEMGCKSLADEVRKSIDVFREHVDQSHYGFNRITMTNAAIILAKFFGFNYHPSQEVSGSFVGTYRTEAKITVDRKFFGNYNFDPEQCVEFDPIVSEITRSPSFTIKQQNPFIYQPRVYPLHEFWELASQDIKDIISLLEEFPDAGNKPIFDHFGVIVPGLSFPPQKDGIFTFLDEHGIAQVFSTKEKAEKALDFTLIAGGFIFPIIVGEKDGKCYFISHFNAKDKNESNKQSNG